MLPAAAQALEQKLTASDGAADDFLGQSVAISGETIVAGAPFDDVGANANQGYRDKQQREVDVIVERHDGEIVGIEVKSSATPASGDFAGLRYLREKLGARFRAGAVLYAGADTLPFGDRLAAVPLSGLWS